MQSVLKQLSQYFIWECKTWTWRKYRTKNYLAYWNIWRHFIIESSIVVVSYISSHFCNCVHWNTGWVCTNTIFEHTADIWIRCNLIQHHLYWPCTARQWCRRLWENNFRIIWKMRNNIDLISSGFLMHMYGFKNSH